MSTLTIAKLAASAQVNVETIRYYQRRGLLAEPARSLDGRITCHALVRLDIADDARLGRLLGSVSHRKVIG